MCEPYCEVEMLVIAQAGLDQGTSGLFDPSYLTWMFAIFCLNWKVAVLTPPVLLTIWFSPEIVQMICDTVRRRDFLAESELDRELEGRLFDPGYKRESTFARQLKT